MYTLLNKLGLKSFLVHESGSLLLAWVIAELFYKFGSFTMETGAFLITWWFIGVVSHRIFKKNNRSGS
jgi:hypothetical protein